MPCLIHIENQSFPAFLGRLSPKWFISGHPMFLLKQEERQEARGMIQIKAQEPGAPALQPCPYGQILVRCPNS